MSLKASTKQSDEGVEVTIERESGTFVFVFEEIDGRAGFLYGHGKTDDGEEMEISESHITETVIQMLEDEWGLGEPKLTRDNVDPELAPKFRGNGIFC